jgi:glutamine synthetase
MDPREQRIEYRIPDAASNPYLVLAAILMAGMDGVQKKMDPEKMGFGPFDLNLYELFGEARAKIKQAPSSLEDALGALKKDHEFLLTGDVFDNEFIEAWIELKMKNDVFPLKQRPHPHEFTLYYDI